MSGTAGRSGGPRDVPPPHPVPPPDDDADRAPDGGLARAARAVAEAVAGLLGPDDGPHPAGRRSTADLLREVVGAVTGTARTGSARGPRQGPATTAAGEGASGWAPGALLTDLLSAAAPRLPIRDAPRLRAGFPGASTDQIADALVLRAARITAGIGAATGGLTAAQWFAPPALLALPLELGAETVLVAAVEVVLVGELHELYGRPAAGDARARSVAYLASWASRRALHGGSATGFFAVLGTAGVGALRRQVTRRLARNLSAVAPLMIGAALAARGNRKATVGLAERVLGDLRTALPGSSL